MAMNRKLKIAFWKLPLFAASSLGVAFVFSEQNPQQERAPAQSINRRPGGWNQSPIVGERPSTTNADGSPVAAPTIPQSQQPASQLEEQLAKSKGFTGFRKSIGTIEMRIDRLANGRLQVSGISPEDSKATGIRDKDEFANWDELGEALNGEPSEHSQNSDAPSSTSN